MAVNKQQAKKLRARGYTYQKIADRLGVSRQRIQQVLYDRNKLKFQRVGKPTQLNIDAALVLTALGLPVEISVLNSLCDLFVAGKPVEVRKVEINKDSKLRILNKKDIKALFLFVGEEWFFIPATKITANIQILYPYRNDSKYARLLDKYKEPDIELIREVLGV